MIDKLFKKIGQPKGDAKPAEKTPEASPATEKEDMLDETGTFMLDMNKLKEDVEDLEDLLNDV